MVLLPKPFHIWQEEPLLSTLCKLTSAACSVVLWNRYYVTKEETECWLAAQASNSKKCSLQTGSYNHCFTNWFVSHPVSGFWDLKKKKSKMAQFLKEHPEVIESRMLISLAFGGRHKWSLCGISETGPKHNILLVNDFRFYPSFLLCWVTVWQPHPFLFLPIGLAPDLPHPPPGVSNLQSEDCMYPQKTMTVTQHKPHTYLKYSEDF